MENKVLCGANSYEEKYYFNEEFSILPEEVKKELNIMCVLFTEDVGGIITVEFRPDGDAIVNVTSDERDYLYDEIDSELKVRTLLKEKEELFKQLETFYKVMILKQDPATALEDEDER